MSVLTFIRRCSASPALVLLIAFLVVACTRESSVELEWDQPEPSDAASEVIEVTPSLPMSAIPGTMARYNFATEGTDAEAFFAHPWPSDLRLNDAGYPDLSGFPNPNDLSLLPPLMVAANQRRGWPQTAVAWFQFDGPVSAAGQGQIFHDTSDAPVMLIDVDPQSPQRGERYPLTYRVLETDPFTADNVVALSPVPGVILKPDRTYAFVIFRQLNDASGEPLGVPLELVQLRAGQAPGTSLGDRALTVFKPLWEVLSESERAQDDVAAATVFTTGDVVADLAVMSDALIGRDEAQLSGFKVDPDDGALHPRFCELVGELTVPQYQVGAPPFDVDGSFELGPDGLPVIQRLVTVPVTLTLPLTEMPDAGFALVTYLHGSGGVSGQLVDRGPVLEVGGPPTPGLGPAHVLAHHGFAAIGGALPLNPERLEGAGDYDYINVANPAVFPFTFQQGLIEQRLMLNAVEKFELSPDVVAECDGLSLPEGRTSYRLDTNPAMVMGQSMGGVYTNMLAATDPRVTAAVPTGAGGLWSWFVLFTDLVDAPPLLGLLFGTQAELTHMHPVMHLAQLAWEGAEPLVFMSRISRSPLEGHPRRDVYEPVGLGDSYFPYPVFDATALAYGNEQAGELVWPSLQDSLALDGLDGLIPYPVSDNRSWPDGARSTNVVVQYEGDGIYDPHAIFAQLDAVKYQYGCFFETAKTTGTAHVLAPKPLGEPCN